MPRHKGASSVESGDVELSAIGGQPARTSNPQQTTLLRRSKPVNAEFFKNARFAISVGVWCTLCALPALLKIDCWFWAPSRLQKAAGDNRVAPHGWSCLICIFVAAPSLGATLQNGSQALVGMLLVFLNDAVLLPILVGFAPDDRWYVDLLCWFDYPMFIVFILAFDFGPKARLIALHFNSAWIMLLLNPKTTIHWSTDPEDGANLPMVGVVCICRTFFGVVCALLATIFIEQPSALQVAQAATKNWVQSSQSLYERTWRATEETIASTKESAGSVVFACKQTKQLVKDSRAFSGKMAAAEALLTVAWWESFVRNKRVMHAQMADLRKLCARLGGGAEHICVWLHRRTQTLSMAADTSGILGLPQPSMLSSLQESLQCMAGRVSDPKQSMGESASEEKGAQQGEALEMLNAAGMKGSTMDELILLTLWALKKASDDAAEAAERLIVPQSLFARLKSSLVQATPGQVNFVLRNTINIVIGALIGVFVLDFDPGIASNIGWLTSRHMGSAVRKNLQRVLGVVLPFIVGCVIYNDLGDCSLMNTFFLAGIFFLVETCCVYAMVSSKEFAYVALLSGAFAPLFMLRPCEKDAPEKLPCQTPAFVAIRGVVLGILLMFFGDVCLAPERASSLAARTILEMWRDLTSALLPHLSLQRRGLERSNTPRVTYFGTPLIKPSLESAKSDLLAIPARISGAQRLCHEAALEMLLWKAPFPADAASTALNAMASLQKSILMLEDLKDSSTCVGLDLRAETIASFRAADDALKARFAPELQRFWLQQSLAQYDAKLVASTCLDEDPGACPETEGGLFQIVCAEISQNLYDLSLS